MNKLVINSNFFWAIWRFLVSIAAMVNKRAQQELDLIEWCDGYEWAEETKDLDIINSYLTVCKDLGSYGEFEKGATEWAEMRYNEIHREIARL